MGAICRIFFTFRSQSCTQHPVIPKATRSQSVGKRALAVALLSIPLLTQTGLSANTTLDEGPRAYQRGAFDEAAAKWRKTVEEYRRQGNAPAQFKAMIDLAAAYQALGQQRHALQILDGAVELAEKSDDRTTGSADRSD